MQNATSENGYKAKARRSSIMSLNESIKTDSHLRAQKTGKLCSNLFTYWARLFSLAQIPQRSPAQLSAALNHFSLLKFNHQSSQIFDESRLQILSQAPQLQGSP